MAYVTVWDPESEQWTIRDNSTEVAMQEAGPKPTVSAGDAGWDWGLQQVQGGDGNAGWAWQRGGPTKGDWWTGERLLNNVVRAVGLGVPAVMAGGAIASGLGSGAGLGEMALAGGGEVGSGYAASAPGWAGMGSGATGAGAFAGGGMNFMDLGGGLALDEFGGAEGGLFQGGESGAYDLGGGLSVDEFGNVTGGLFEGGPGTAGAGDFFNPMGGDLLSMLKNIPNSLLSKLLGSNGGALGKAIGGGAGGLFGGGGLDAAARMAPGLLALAYANQQPGIDTNGIQGVLDKVGGNQNAIIQAATDPLQMNIARGYGDMLQSQAQRGIRGSSFGSSDIANYISSTGRSLADAGANAAQGSLALQGDLSTKIAALKNQAQQVKNNLFGKAYDVLGRGLGGSSGLQLNLGGT